MHQRHATSGEYANSTPGSPHTYAGSMAHPACLTHDALAQCLCHGVCVGMDLQLLIDVSQVKADRVVPFSGSRKLLRARRRRVVAPPKRIIRVDMAARHHRRQFPGVNDEWKLTSDWFCARPVT